MSEASTPEVSANKDKHALETFVVANAELDALETLLSQFNIFDAIGVTRQELRHSDFLAFLLDPNQSHGLGDAFVRRFLQLAIMSVPEFEAPIGPIDLDVWSLDRVTVAREWRNIDILLLDEQHKVAVIIENKIGSTEHSEQLPRYLKIVKNTYKDWKVLPIFLTPAGDAPSDTAYLPINYDLVCQTVEALAESRRAIIDHSVTTTILHYSRMLRREVVSDSETAELCRLIYQKHKRALDLIYKHLPSLQDELATLLRGWVEAEPSLILDSAAKSFILFSHPAMESPLLKAGQGWSASGRIVLFEFGNRPERLELTLSVGPGPLEIRQRVIDVALSHPQIFTVAKKPTPKWTRIFSRTILQKTDYVNASLADVTPRIKDQWDHFISDDLPKITKALCFDNDSYEISLQKDSPTLSPEIQVTSDSDPSNT